MSNITTKTLAKLDKGDLFTVLSFTGLQFGTYIVTAVSKTKFKTLNRKSEEMIFNRADGMQVVEPGKEKWANRAVDLFPEAERKPLVEPETEEEHKARRKARRAERKAAAAAKTVAPAAKADTKKAKKAAPAPEPEEVEEEEVEEVEEEAPAPKKGKKDTKKADTKKAPAKKADEDDGWED